VNVIPENYIGLSFRLSDTLQINQIKVEYNLKIHFKKTIDYTIEKKEYVVNNISKIEDK